MGRIVKRKEVVKTGIHALDLVGRPGEVAVYVFYDIENDRVRSRAARICKDFGLERTQFSGFVGYLSRNKREELGIKLRDNLDGSTGKVLIQPVCDKDFKQYREYIELNDEADAGTEGE
ncbi:MAG: CRISPR-associated endonuclease Cas2 [Deltaproteobacteria bacterium]|nr:CRISPR-associated endonuclease Cas2 [Deltaproteobacteria bacterium]